eukprot:SM000039S14493  [mRNA]  locus=s39:396784:403749:- [translate_table: standard]
MDMLRSSYAALAPGAPPAPGGPIAAPDWTLAEVQTAPRAMLRQSLSRLSPDHRQARRNLHCWSLQMQTESMINPSDYDEIVGRVVEMQVQQLLAGPPGGSRHVLCSGVQQPPFMASRDLTKRSHSEDVLSTPRNLAMDKLLSPPWRLLHTQVGDKMMLYLLNHASIFVPLQDESFLQVSGQQIDALARAFSKQSTPGTQLSAPATHSAEQGGNREATKLLTSSAWRRRRRVRRHQTDKNKQSASRSSIDTSAVEEKGSAVLGLAVDREQARNLPTGCSPPLLVSLDAELISISKVDMEDCTDVDDSGSIGRSSKPTKSLTSPDSPLSQPELLDHSRTSPTQDCGMTSVSDSSEDDGLPLTQNSSQDGVKRKAECDLIEVHMIRELKVQELATVTDDAVQTDPGQVPAFSQACDPIKVEASDVEHQCSGTRRQTEKTKVRRRSRLPSWQRSRAIKVKREMTDTFRATTRNCVVADMQQPISNSFGQPMAALCDDIKQTDDKRRKYVLKLAISVSVQDMEAGYATQEDDSSMGKEQEQGSTLEASDMLGNSVQVADQRPAEGLSKASSKWPNVNYQELVSLYSSHTEVASFVWSVLRSIIPCTLLGNQANQQQLRKTVHRFVRLRRKEELTLQQVLYKLRITGYAWLCKERDQPNRGLAMINNTIRIKRWEEHDPRLVLPSPVGTNSDCRCTCPELMAANSGSTDVLDGRQSWQGSQLKTRMAKKEQPQKVPAGVSIQRQKLLQDWIFWVFNLLVIPLIRSHFYVTESETHRQLVFYYRKPVWARICATAHQDLGASIYERLTPARARCILQRRLGFARVRLLPRINGVRPLANLSAKTQATFHIRRRSLASIFKRGAQKTKVAAQKSTSTFRASSPITASVDEIGSALPLASTGICLDSLSEQQHVSLLPSPSNFKEHAGRKSKSSSAQTRKREQSVVVAFKAINSCLKDVHGCFQQEAKQQQEGLGYSVFGYDDIHKRLKAFIVSLKKAAGELPMLYLAVCDVAKAFDSVSQKKLCQVVESFLENDQYCVQRYTKLQATKKSIMTFYKRAVTTKLDQPNVELFRQKCSILIDQGSSRMLTRRHVLQLHHQHVTENVVMLGKSFFRQQVGIPQGSILSPFLCSLFYGHLERHMLLPQLVHEGGTAGTLSSEMEELPSATMKEQAGYPEAAGIGHEDPLILLAGCTIPPSAKQPSCDQASASSRSSAFLLLRLIDDSLFVSTSAAKAASYVELMHRGFEDYGCRANQGKTRVSFPLSLGAKPIATKEYVDGTGERFIPWSGLLINCASLEVQADYTRYCGDHISSSINVACGRFQGLAMAAKLRLYLRPKCHPLFYDPAINSPATVRLNIYQAFLLCAMKFHAYMHSMNVGVAKNPNFFFNAILQAIRYMHALVQNRLRLAAVAAGQGAVSDTHMEVLGCRAFYRVLKRKQARYASLLTLMSNLLSSTRLRAIATDPILINAMSDDRSSLFKDILY